MTAHRHKGLNGKWLTVVGGDGAHGHPEIEAEMTTLANRLSLVEGRVSALELPAPPPPPEPPDPPPNPPDPPDPEGGLNVPGTIDATGATDASAALNAWIASVPNDSTIIFPEDGIYRMGSGITLANRTGLTFIGNGTTLRSNAGTLNTDSLFYLNFGNRNIRIYDFNLVGSSPTPGIWNASGEHAHGICIRGGYNVDIDHVTISAVWGDGVYVSGLADTVWLHDSTIASCGRMGVAVTSGKNVTVERCALTAIGYGAFDIEPNDATQGGVNVKFINNTVGVISQVRGKAFFFGANGNADAVISDVLVDGNTVTGDSLDTYVTVGRRKRITFTDNTALGSSPGPVLYFAHVDGLTITGNTQPLTSGDLASISDCTDVVKDF
jgi:hypothetical protein